jgi:hypothetical protein
MLKLIKNPDNFIPRELALAPPARTGVAGAGCPRVAGETGEASEAGSEAGFTASQPATFVLPIQ